MPTFVCNAATNGTGALQSFTVPSTGPYRIRAVGAQGGNAYGGTGLGGQGADIAGDFTLTAGDIIDIMVGSQPPIFSSAYVNGGGGGTFVVKRSGNTPLVVAGGGNGASHDTPGPNARLTSTGSSGGTNAAAGAGFNGNGTTDSWVSVPANSYLNGGKGAGPGAYSNYGGYGGGACTHGNDGTQFPGGGGYQGGDSSGGANMGGGSYNAGTNQANSLYTAGGNGFASITLLNAPPSAPSGLSVRNGMYAVKRAKASWTHVDSDGDPQAKYQLRWRVVI